MNKSNHDVSAHTAERIRFCRPGCYAWAGARPGSLYGLGYAYPSDRSPKVRA
jgi:hypothetical protein